MGHLLVVGDVVGDMALLSQFDLGMEVPTGSPVVKFHVECPCCDAPITLEVDIQKSKHRILDNFKADFSAMMMVVEAYKRIKGYDRIPTWDQSYRGRAMAAAKKLLRFFRKLQDPVGVAIEAMGDLQDKAFRENWGDKFNLESAVKLAPDWLIGKQKARR